MLRFVQAIAAAAVAVLALSVVPVSADSTTGQTGNYLFTDAQATPGARCYYVDEGGAAVIHKFTVKPPKMWWPDTDSNNDTQHGKVGWKFIVEQDQGSWVKVKQSSIQKATAYEDSQDPYDNSTKANFSKMSLTINAYNFSGGMFRVTVKGYWYKPNGSVLGTTSHTVYWYKYGGTSTATVSGGCAHSG